jgi:hypothetical protein
MVGLIRSLHFCLSESRGDCGRCSKHLAVLDADDCMDGGFCHRGNGSSGYRPLYVPRSLGKNGRDLGGVVIRVDYDYDLCTRYGPLEAERVDLNLKPGLLTLPLGGVMVGLSDNQLRIVMTAAGALPVSLRDRFLQAMAARLRGARYPTDSELSSATQRALQDVDRDDAA